MKRNERTELVTIKAFTTGADDAKPASECRRDIPSSIPTVATPTPNYGEGFHALFGQVDEGHNVDPQIAILS